MMIALAVAFLAQAAPTTVHLSSGAVAGSLPGTLLFRTTEGTSPIKVTYYSLEGPQIEHLYQDGASFRAGTEAGLLVTQHQKEPDDALVAPLIVAFGGRDAGAVMRAMNEYMVATGSATNFSRQDLRTLQAKLLGELDTSGATPRLRRTIRLTNGGSVREIAINELSRRK